MSAQSSVLLTRAAILSPRLGTDERSTARSEIPFQRTVQRKTKPMSEESLPISCSYRKGSYHGHRRKDVWRKMPGEAPDFSWRQVFSSSGGVVCSTRNSPDGPEFLFRSRPGYM